ncbi:YdcF family protein [Sphingomicrobium aestuariivivum]|uniref:YdcF family protein n=1 Tax=Sphingomicrobium aestuariivivum TaxID=1582356 RepID=UPI001FD65DB4|nr:YdcF family protein [Sphingomicrobium aestuariivivum]MCJ8191182.1 YdcF family protein [Sphingomicrobium aestuariivivum]
MILRLFSFVVALYALGFILFAVSLGQPAPGEASAQAAVVLTGGSGRIEQGIERLEEKRADRLLIAGADPLVTQADLVEVTGGRERLFDCCITIGSESVDTRTNAEEAKAWIDAGGYDEIMLVTSDWHMRRAAFEFRETLGDDVTVIEDAVRTEPTLLTLFGEYNKYVLRRVGLLVGL